MRWRGALALVLVTAACAPAVSSTPSPATAASQSIAATPTSGTTAAPNPSGICGTVPSGTAGTVLFFSDLTAKCAAIGNEDNADRSLTHAENGYRVHLKTGPGIEFGGGPDRSQFVSPPPSAVRVEMDAQVISGKALLGLTCHHSETGRAFKEDHLAIGTDGSFTIEGGPPYRTIASGTATVTLRAGLTHFRADCIGPTLTLFVNGQQVATGQDDQITGTLAGIFVRSLDAAGTEVLFTNLLITTP